MTEDRAREHVHLLGIGGTGMTALAGLLHESGCRISGSDRALYPPTSTILERLGLDVRIGFDPAHLDPSPDLVVVGNAISRGNPELEAVLDRRLPMTSMPRLIEERFLPGRHSIVVAGTHGKTTTASMLAWVLRSAGLEPGFLIGGAPIGFDYPFQIGRGGPFVIEGDEYDTAYFDKGPKFMHYRPDTVLLGAVEFDHADIYRDLEQVRTAFARLVNLVPRKGLLIYGADHSIPTELASGAPCRTIGFGASDADWRLADYEEAPSGARFRIVRRGEAPAPVTLAVPGRHNAANALAVAVAAADLGLGLEQIRSGLESFRGVRRRLELRGEVAGVTVFDDFAHHPTAIEETIASVRRRYADRRVWAVLEPRSWSLRRNVFQERLVTVFDGADRVVIAPVYAASAIADEQRLDPRRLVADLSRRGRDARSCDSVDAVLEQLVEECREGDVVVIMSNGGFEALHDRLLEGLRSRRAVGS